jgi:hypothetical protein
MNGVANDRDHGPKLRLIDGDVTKARIGVSDAEKISNGKGHETFEG